MDEQLVSFKDFEKLNLRTAKILEVTEHPDADKLYVLKIDLGTETRQIVAGIKLHYQAEELIGRQIVVVENLAPATIRGVESQGMLLAAKDDELLTIISPEKEIKPGSPVN
ncbi:MAG: methionine--tRNA ligase subunit beta [Candidatus Omnitrophica bacterium]|nr:methionine--tRNA ligase subunit beta [Candidatus Omnitrophota bacterium]